MRRRGRLKFAYRLRRFRHARRARFRHARRAWGLDLHRRHRWGLDLHRRHRWGLDLHALRRACIQLLHGHVGGCRVHRTFVHLHRSNIMLHAQHLRALPHVHRGVPPAAGLRRPVPRVRFPVDVGRGRLVLRVVFALYTARCIARLLVPAPWEKASRGIMQIPICWAPGVPAPSPSPSPAAPETTVPVSVLVPRHFCVFV